MDDQSTIVLKPAGYAELALPQEEGGRPAVGGEILQRGFHVGLAVVLLVATLPLWVVIAALIKLTSRGPVFYVQPRVGRGGRIFRMWKFRSMRVDAEATTGPVWATRSDPRRTVVGVILRRFSLDELPQLINVVRGEMSLVGPRPERPCFVAQFGSRFPHYHARHATRPGITGWAQVNGCRGATSVEARLELDLHYIRHRSLWLDFRILCRTPWAVLTAENAY